MCLANCAIIFKEFIIAQENVYFYIFIKTLLIIRSISKIIFNVSEQHWLQAYGLD